MVWKNFLILLQAIIAIPLFMLIAYVGFWITLISGPLIVGIIVLVVSYFLIKEYSLYKKQKETDEL
jgi:uncharacterized protein YqhQ